MGRQTRNRKAASATAAAAVSRPVASENRRIRIFVSSTFRDMIAEREELMTRTWPVLRRLGQGRHVEVVEVDLRWGIAEEQSKRQETLKLCLDEISACRPFFIGLLGQRYGWTPEDDAFTADLVEEQPWLASLRDRSVTELEILHGVLNNPEMADRAFFYFRDPAYARGRGPDFLSETKAAASKQTALKRRIRTVCAAQGIPLRKNYPDPRRLADMVLADLTGVLESQFPETQVPDDLTREEQGHEAFAETRRRTYIGRSDYFDALDRHAAGTGGPLLVLGASGSGKSALLANWLRHWCQQHPQDFIFQHYIGSTADSADHWRLMTRLMAAIRRWIDDPEPLPTTHDDILSRLPLWLAKARAKASHEGRHFLLVLDALNQLNDQDHACLLGWLPEHSFAGPLRLIASTLPGGPGTDDPLAAARKRHWQELPVEPLTVAERSRMSAAYLARFGKKLDAHRLERLAAAPATSNPLYLKILLDDLRVTGTHDRLDERLTEYLAAADIPALLQQVLARYQRDYDRDRPGLVSQTLGLIYAARRGLSESELLDLLRPPDQAQLPAALWTPLRAALEDSLVDRGGILNFAHDFLRTAVANTFVADPDCLSRLRLQLADYFETLPGTARTCDELPWLLQRTNSRARLRACLLEIDRFLLVQSRDENELLSYWLWLRGQQTMGEAYLASFEQYAAQPDLEEPRIVYAANELALFLRSAALYAEAESLTRRALDLDERSAKENPSRIAVDLSNLATLLQETGRRAEAEPLLRRVLALDECTYGKDHHRIAVDLSNLASLLQETNRLAEAESLLRDALALDERIYGKDHPRTVICLNNLAALLQETNQVPEAESLMRRVLALDEGNYGEDHPDVASDLSNLAQLLKATNRLTEAEPLMRRALALDERSYGKDHPAVAICLNNLAQLLQASDRLSEAEPLLRRALAIDRRSYGRNHSKLVVRLSNLALLLKNTGRLTEAEQLLQRALALAERSFGPDHPKVALCLTNLAQLFKVTHRSTEAEPLMERALAIDERSYGSNHPEVAIRLNNLAQLLKATGRLTEAEPLMRRHVEIFLQFTRSTGRAHPHLSAALDNYSNLLYTLGRSPTQIRTILQEMCRRYGVDLGWARGTEAK